MSSPNRDGHVVPPPEGVCCAKCWDAAFVNDPRAWLLRTFIVCSTCGNKRCPKATDHDLECTSSNEPGQPGSRYT